MSSPFDLNLSEDGATEVDLERPPPASATPPPPLASATTSTTNGKKKKKTKNATPSVPPTGLADIELTSASISPPPQMSSAAANPNLFDFTSISVMPSPSPSPIAPTLAPTSLSSGRSGPTSASSTSSGSSSSSVSSTRASNSNYEHKSNDGLPETPLSHSTLAALEPVAFERNIIFNEASSRLPSNTIQTQVFPSNVVRTSKYTAWDFLPRNLFEQFLEPANCYFLFVGILQAIPAISTTAGVPTHYLPLSFILTVSAIRSAIEDYNRHKADEAEGRKRYLVYDGAVNEFVTKTSAEIVVGDIVKMVFGKDPAEAQESVVNGFDSLHSLKQVGRDPNTNYSSSFPADMLLLSSSHEKGHCFVETASLDGETNLKIKNAIPTIQNLLYVTPTSLDPSGNQVNQLRKLDLSLDVEGPNSRFDSFKGLLHLNPNGTVPGVQQQKLALKPENLLLRGTELRNTPSIYGLVVYTGVDTKIRRNVKSSNMSIKKSQIMTHVNYLLVCMLCFQLSLCILGALLCFSWTSNNFTAAWYLLFNESAAIAAVRSFFTWFIILAQMVPISLLVSNELVKAAQAQFIAWDISMYDPKTDQPTIVRNTQLHEDLGQVEYIFSDKTGTLTQNKMEFRVGFVGAVPFGSPDSEIARRVAMRMEQLRQQNAASNGSSSSSSSPSSLHREPQLTWTERVEKLMSEQRAGHQSMPAFNDAEKERMLIALWGRKGGGHPEDAKLAQDIRTFLTHMAISNTITPELQTKSSSMNGHAHLSSHQEEEEEYVLNFSSPDELALCKYAAHMGFQFQSRGQKGIQLAINKLGYGDNVKEVEIYQSLGTLDFNSKRKRVTCIYLRDRTVYVMCKGADANVLPLVHYQQDSESLKLRDTLDVQLTDMATKGLRTLVVLTATLPYEWWFGDGTAGNEGVSGIYKSTNLPDRGAEKGHHRGECHAECRICSGLFEIEKRANLRLLGATAIEDRLQDLVPECISDFLQAGIKVWMLTGDKRETAKNIGLACNLLDPDMEQQDLIGSLSVDDMNRVVEITGDWVTMTNNHDQLRQMFDILDCGGDIVDGVRTNYISREELRYFLIGLRVTGMDDDRKFDAQWRLVDARGDGRIAFPEFARFIKNLKPSHLKAVQTDIELGLRKARLIAGDGSPEEKRARLEHTPISLVVEGEAFSVFFPDKPQATGVTMPGSLPIRANGGRRLMFGASMNGPSSPSLSDNDDDDFNEPEVLLLRETFFELASMAKSVICCRLTPSQKGRIVEEFVRKGHVTLAIGDGGNDELMIKRASVGVGITGLEGTAASRAADYAIANFRFLHTLLFVHGWWCYRRISKLVTFIFYKAALVALSMYLFGFVSAFSGQQFYNDVIYILFNVCFTAVPIVILAIFDQGGLSKATLENDPRAYLSISHRALFNDRIFVGWIARAGWNAIFIAAIVYFALGEDVSGEAGQNHGLWLSSTVEYTIVVCLVTFRILFECQTLNLFVVFFVILSFCTYFPVVLLCSNMLFLNPNLYGTFYHIFSDPFIWCVMIFSVALPLMIDIGVAAKNRYQRPTYVDVLQERQRLTKTQLQLMDQDLFPSNASQSSARVRTRTVPQLSQQQKDEKLLAKIRKALQQQAQQQAQQDPSKSDSIVGQQDAQRRAEALVYTMNRLQNLSGSNFDATPQRNIMSLYEVTGPLTNAQLAELKEREKAIAEEQQKQHQVELLKQEQLAKQWDERRQLEQQQQQQQASRSFSDSHPRDEFDRRKKRGKPVHRPSDGSSSAQAGMMMDFSGSDEDEEIVSHTHQRSDADGTGVGRIHLHNQLLDEEEEPVDEEIIHTNSDSHIVFNHRI